MLPFHRLRYLTTPQRRQSCNVDLMRQPLVWSMVDSQIPDDTPCIGLDGFILDPLGPALIFMLFGWLFALHREQPRFRPEWQTALHHFIVNHMVVGFVLPATNLLAHILEPIIKRTQVPGPICVLGSGTEVIDLTRRTTSRSTRTAPPTSRSSTARSAPR